MEIIGRNSSKRTVLVEMEDWEVERLYGKRDLIKEWQEGKGTFLSDELDFVDLERARELLQALDTLFDLKGAK